MMTQNSSGSYESFALCVQDKHLEDTIFSRALSIICLAWPNTHRHHDDNLLQGDLIRTSWRPDTQTIFWIIQETILRWMLWFIYLKWALHRQMPWYDTMFCWTVSFMYLAWTQTDPIGVIIQLSWVHKAKEQDDTILCRTLSDVFFRHVSEWAYSTRQGSDVRIFGCLFLFVFLTCLSWITPWIRIRAVS